MSRRRQIYEGKAKILYEGPEPGTLIQYFKDDATAFNAEKKGTINGKGVINNRISEHVFTRLANIGIPTHFIRRLNMREQLIRQVEIIPLEVVVRNVAAGSLCKRLGLEEGEPLPHSLIEYYYKDDGLGDPLVAEEHIGSGVVMATAEDEEHEVDIKERLEREGGASGNVQISLAWDDYNDLDLHLFCPSGERIYFNNKKSECGGILDVDMNVRPVSNTPVENVVWKGEAPLGTYKVGVHFYKHHRKRRTKRTCKFRIRVVTHGESREYLGKITYGQAMQMVTSFSLADATHKA